MVSAYVRNLRLPARLAAVAVLALVSTSGSACGSGEERAIRNQMSLIAESMTVPANDGELGRVARIATLRRALAPDVRVYVAGVSRGSQPSEIAGRDAVLALAGRWIPPAEGVSVEFLDVQVTLDEGGTSARVYCTARASSGTPERPVVDARELTVSFSKIDGTWMVTAVRAEDTLIR